MSEEQNEVLAQQQYLLERRMYRLDPAPPKLPTQEYIIRYLPEKEDKYLAWYLHDQEPALNKLVQTACERYGMTEHFSDMKQAAVCGILTALQKYDPAVGAPFVAFQKRYIQDSIEDYIRTAQSGAVTMTPDTYPVLRRIMAIYHRDGDNGNDETIERIADEVGMEYMTVKRYLAIGLLNECRADFYKDYDENGEETDEDITVDYSSEPEKLYSSSVSRVFTTWLRWGVLYRFGMGCKPPFTYHKKWAGLLAIFGAFPVCRTEIFLRRKPHSRVWGRHSPTSFPRGAKPQNCGFWHRGRNLL